MKTSHAIKIIVVCLIIITRICFAVVKIRTNQKSDLAVTDEVTTKILTSCYGNEGNAIGIIGALPKTFLTRLWSRKLIPVVLINPTELIVNDDPFEKPTKLPVIVILDNTTAGVLLRLQQIRNSPWYNHLATFLITVSFSSVPIEKDGILNILYNCWYFHNIYNANVIYSNKNGIVKIFDFNPHMGWAPKHWKLYALKKKRSNGFFTVFWHKYDEDKEMCNKLNIDKTIDLGGEVIEFLTPENYVNRNSKGHHGLHSKKRNDNILNIFISHINASVQEKFVNFPRDINSSQYLYILVKGILTYPVYHTEEVQMHMSYPVSEVREKILTQFRGYQSQLSKILSVIDWSSRIGLLIVLLITAIYFKYFEHQNLTTAILNVVRIICSENVTSSLHTVSSRTYLACLLFFVITIQGIFTGKLSALLTTDIPLRQANSVQDLVDLGYTIHTKLFTVPFLSEFIPDEYIVIIKYGTNCAEEVIFSPDIACIGVDYEMMDDASTNDNLYVGNEAVGKHYVGFHTALNWPLRKKFNKILAEIKEADIQDPLHLRVKLQRLSIALAEKMTNNDPKILTLKDLKFAFVILGIGVGLASISFIVELFIDSRSSKITKL